MIDYELDGVSVNWEDTPTLLKGTGEKWLITFTEQLRILLKDKIITHAPPAPYFQ